MSKSTLLKVVVTALIVAAIVTSVFCYLEKDSAYSALTSLPADADIVFAFDLRSLQEDEIVVNLMEKAEDQEWYEVPKNFDWRDIHTLSGAIWLDKDAEGVEPTSFVWALRGDFDMDLLEDFIELGKEKGASAKETEFMDSDAWEIDDDVLIVWVDEGVVALGNKDALEKFIEAYDGETDQVGDSKDYAGLLEHVDSAADLVIVAADTPASAGDISGVSFSMENGSEMNLSLFLETDEASDIADLISDGLDNSEKSLDAIDVDALEVDDMGISKKQLKGLLNSASAFFESVKIDERDDGVLVEANTEMPEGITSFSAPLAAVGIPAFIKYMRRAKTTEAIDQLDKIYKGAAYYYTAPHIDGEGRKLPCQFPATQAPTPAGTCCGSLGGPDKDGDGRCDANPNDWATLTWESLTFQMNDDHYFVYSFESSGVLSNAQFTASAYGDLDCDGVMSTFQRIGFGDPKANFAECAMSGSPAFFVDNETE